MTTPRAPLVVLCRSVEDRPGVCCHPVGERAGSAYCTEPALYVAVYAFPGLSWRVEHARCEEHAATDRHPGPRLGAVLAQLRTVREVTG